MAMHFEVDGSFAVVTCEGTFTMEDIHRIVEWIRTDETLPERAKFLTIDRLSSFDPSTPQLEEVAQLYASVKERISSRWALVVAKQYHFGLARMCSVFAEEYGLEARVFTEVAEARAWLDHPASGH